jgi:serine/threonine protein kinase
VLLPNNKYAKINKNIIKDATQNARKYLNTIGIVYLDYKIDNIGISKNNNSNINVGDIKLFDFDCSGVINTNNNKWLIEPCSSYIYTFVKLYIELNKTHLGIKGRTIQNIIDYDEIAIRSFFNEL